MKESRTVEFKRDLTKSYLKTVSAFANYGDGDVLFGIDDEGSIIGVEDPNFLCLSIESAICDGLEPEPRFTDYLRIQAALISFAAAPNFMVSRAVLL